MDCQFGNFFWSPGGRPSALHAVFFNSRNLHSAILIKARLHMYAMPRPHSVCGTWWICMPQWIRWLACTPLLYWATCYYIFMSIYDVHIHSTLVNRMWFQRFGQANKSTSCDYKIAGRIWLGVKNVSWQWRSQELYLGGPAKRANM